MRYLISGKSSAVSGRAKGVAKRTPFVHLFPKRRNFELEERGWNVEAGTALLEF